MNDHIPTCFSGILRLFLTAIFMSFPINVDAAEFTKSSIKGCSISLNGEIKSGDLERFKTIASTLGLIDGESDGEVLNRRNEALCLDSPGGNFDEGRKISKLIREFGISTRVPRNAKCLSACAFIFMAGRIRGDEFDGSSRMLDAKGTLGFHGPYLVYHSRKKFNAKILGLISVLQNLILADFISYSSQGYEFDHRPIVAQSLLSELLKQTPDKFVYVDTIEKIARWNIDLVGISEEFSLNKRSAHQACENVLSWPFDQSSNLVKVNSNSAIDYESAKDEDGNNKSYAIIDFTGYSTLRCKILVNELVTKKISNQSVSGISVCTDNGYNGINIGNCPIYEIWFPAYYILPPRTLITSLAK